MKLITTTEAAQRLGIASRATVIRLIRNGTLKGARVGHLWKVYASSVDEILKG